MRIEYQLTHKQDECWEYLTSEEDCAILYGGAKGGGKTFLLCLWAFYWAKELIKRFGLKLSIYPVPLGFIGRKRSVDFTNTTLETWKKIIPATSYILKEQEKEIIIEGAGKIDYGGLDDEEQVKKFNSAEYAFFALDQAEETERSDVSTLEATLRLRVNGIIPPYKRLYTANPAECWLKEDFIVNRFPRHYFVPALPKDNPYLPENYIRTLEEAFKYDETLLRAYRDGDWDVLAKDNVLIPSKLIEDLKTIHRTETQIKKIISCDPSQGGDECVIFVFENSRIVDPKILHEKDTMKIAGEIMLLSARHKINDIAIDSIGIGAGVADRVKELGKNVYAINSAEKSKSERFYNLRAEMWWYVYEQIVEKNIAYPEDEELRRQLSSVRYKVVNSNGQIQLEPKEQTKKRLGCSPDRADAFVYGIYHLRFVFSEQEKKKTDGYFNEPAELDFMRL